MATSKSVETLNYKVEKLIAAYKAQATEIEELKSNNGVLKNEIELLRERTVDAKSSFEKGSKEKMTKRIDLLMREVDKCMNLLEN